MGEISKGIVKLAGNPNGMGSVPDLALVVEAGEVREPGGWHADRPCGT